MVKVLKCGEVFSGCDTVIYGKDEDEVVAKEEEHARKDHNMTMIPMDTIKDRQRLEALYESGSAPWRIVGPNTAGEAGRGRSSNAKPLTESSVRYEPSPAERGFGPAQK